MTNAPESEIETTRRCDVHCARHRDPTEPKAGDFLAGCRLLQCVYEDLDRILLGALLDDLERTSHDPVRFRLLSGVVLRAHHVVDQPLDEVRLRLAERLLRPAPSRVRDHDRGEVHAFPEPGAT